MIPIQKQFFALVQSGLWDTNIDAALFDQQTDWQQLHRQCGDIDLYIGKKNYETANKLLRQESTDEHEENHKRTCIHWHNVDIENHRILLRLSSPFADRNFQQEISRWHGTAACRNQEIEGCLVTRATKRCREFSSLVPAEARWYPFALALHSAQAQWNKLSNRIK